MADVLLDMVQRLQQVKNDLPQLVREVVEENASLIEDKNIEQLQRGEMIDGSSLPDYSPTSVFKYGKPPGPIKLFDTGAFYRGITAEVFENRFEMIGRDIKSEYLEGKYGQVVGLQDENKQEVIDEILRPELIRKTRNLVLNEQL